MKHVPKESMVQQITTSTGLSESSVVELIATISDRQKIAKIRLEELNAQILQLQNDVVSWTAKLAEASTALAALVDEVPDPVVEEILEPVVEEIVAAPVKENVVASDGLV
jgi:hypothetical protein